MSRPESPRTAEQVLDADFFEHRAKLLDLAAFFDRVEHASVTGRVADDPRLPALRDALAILQDGQPQRARRVLERWSDPTTELLDHAPTTPVQGVTPR
ncbi:MAG: hypothetical protein AAGH92_11995 [Planctomycetota bacterium]